MQFRPEGQLIFSYEEGKHLPSTLNIKNTGTQPLIFKFKASSPSKFSIKPNPGMIKPVIIHRDIVQNIEAQQVQILYGVKQYSTTANFGLLLENGSRKDQLNLTMMVEQKQSRVKQLQDDLGSYSMGSMKKPITKKTKSSNLVVFVVVAVLGLVSGYFSPLSIFE